MPHIQLSKPAEESQFNPHIEKHLAERIHVGGRQRGDGESRIGLPLRPLGLGHDPAAALQVLRVITSALHFVGIGVLRGSTQSRVVNQMPRRHQIEHGRNDAAVQSWRRDLAVFWKSFFILRPQPVAALQRLPQSYPLSIWFNCAREHPGDRARVLPCPRPEAELSAALDRLIAAGLLSRQGVRS